MARWLAEEAAGRGMRMVLATCPGDCEPGRGFLRRPGFEIGASEPPPGETAGNRTRHPGENGLRTARLRLDGDR